MVELWTASLNNKTTTQYDMLLTEAAVVTWLSSVVHNTQPGAVVVPKVHHIVLPPCRSNAHHTVFTCFNTKYFTVYFMILYSLSFILMILYSLSFIYNFIQL
jgi:hypothetical protein